MIGGTVLLTGGNGFLGQHIIKHLQNYCSDISEIRVIDKNPFVKKIDFAEKIPIKKYIGDISAFNDLNEAFQGVECVFHCAALVSYRFPADENELEKNNVEGTKNVLQQCLKNNVTTLIYTSSAEVCMVPFFKNGFFSIVVNQTENKALTTDNTELIFGKYAESKLKGEKLILEADNSQFSQGCGKLRTVALRPTFMFGEGDTKLVPSVMAAGNQMNGNFINIAGYGGRHQLVYAGNVAWAHICARKVMKERPEIIAGLPIFITDDTQVEDLMTFCQKITQSPQREYRYKVNWWRVPAILSFSIATAIEVGYNFINKLIKPLAPLPISPRSLVTFLSSILYFNRMRASIYLNYTPIYSQKESFELSSVYYNLFLQNKKKVEE